MYDARKHQVSDRIVSIRQPHIRPIIRGKARSDVEFGAKVSLSVIEKFLYGDRISFDEYNEGGDLSAQVEACRQRTGTYPEKVLADKIYRTRENIRYCTERRIQLSGPKLGRPYQSGSSESSVQKKSQRIDEIERVEVKDKIGVLKRLYSWDLVKARLVETSEAWIMLAAIVANLNTAYRAMVALLLLFFVVFHRVSLSKWARRVLGNFRAGNPCLGVMTEKKAVVQKTLFIVNF